MPHIKLSNIDFSNFLKYEDVLNQLSPQIQLDDLNSSIIKTEVALYLVIKETSSFAKIDIVALIEGDTDANMGISINYPLFFKIVHSYTTEQLQSLIIDIETGNNSHFKIDVASDKISLPHLVMTDDQLKEITSLIDVHYDLTNKNNAFQLSLFNDGKTDFLQGISCCLPFLDDKEERKNNAFALYNNRMLVNDKRHIFIYNYSNPVIFMKDSEPTVLHRKSAKMFSILFSRKINFNAAINSDQSKVFILSDRFEAILNNSISNILPPSQGDMDALRPNKAVYFVKASTLLDTSLFFQGFYRSAMEYKPLTLSVETRGIRFILRDSGVAGYNSCYVERFLSFEQLPENVTEDKVVVSTVIMNESFLRYLKEIDKEELLTIYMDDKKKAVYIQNSKKEIYLAKLG